MSRFYKLLIFFIIVFFVLLILAWGFLPTMISKNLSSKAKVKVTIESLQFSPRSIHIERVSVGNPPKAKFDQAMTLQEGAFYAPLWNYFKHKLLINEIQLKGLNLDIELGGPEETKGNWNYILGNLNEASSKDSSDSKDSSKSSSVLIQKLVITKVQVRIYDHRQGKLQILKPIPRIELKNISSKKGIPSAQIMNLVLQETIRNVFTKEGVEGLIKEVIPKDKSGLMQFFEEVFHTQ